MLADVHYSTQVHTDVFQGLIVLDKQAQRHFWATCSQLVCLVILLASTIGMMSIPPLSSMNYTTVSLQAIWASPVERLFIFLIIGSFGISWIFWLRDLKYQTLASKYDQLYREHLAMIKASAPLTELNAHYRYLMSLASHFTLTSNVILLAYAAAIIIYHLQP
ncbi:hypothetical protein ACFP1H_04665 [Secundilactobacillus hailunensis]|uniref:DUF3899 domain-containing protein n=1 Tax=Secundilactobacillus hailunensis TaxID=2559923 RepID=A0ABW1T731_9LACO|nr:hypothetical protein [Secundilactobacillus hailunensis]